MNAQIRPDPVAHLAKMIARYGSSPFLRLAMVWAYFDETVISQAAENGKLVPSELLVGGCVATQADWEIFSRAWAKALKKERVGVFHATDFYQFRKPFDWFTKDGEPDYGRHNAFSNELADIISHHVDEATAFTSPISLKRGKLRVAYGNGIALAMNDASKMKLFRGEPTYVILARHPELSPWSIIRYFENFDWEKRLLGCGVFDPKDVPPLQAADFILHSINKSWGGDLPLRYSSTRS
jgi:hypothetical protein